MGTALETVTLQHNGAKQPRQVRISGNVRRAIDLMVHTARKRAEAAAEVGITDDAMRKAMQKPEVLAYLGTQQQMLRTSAAARSIARVDKLADEAESEHVQLQSNVFLLGLEGVAPVQRTESIQHSVHHYPGLQIVYASPATETLIHGQQHEGANINRPNGLPIPVPHPSARNASDGRVIDGEFEPAKTGGVGVK